MKAFCTNIPTAPAAAAVALVLAAICGSVRADGHGHHSYGFQSGNLLEPSNDDSYAGSMYLDAQHNLLFVTGSTYGSFFDSATDLDGDIKAAMGMSAQPAAPHLDTSDCFLAVIKLPTERSSVVMLGNGDGNAAPWLAHVDDQWQGTGTGAGAANGKATVSTSASTGTGAGASTAGSDGARGEPSGGGNRRLHDHAETSSSGSGSGSDEPELIYARRFGTKHNSETCSSILVLPKVNDSLLQTTAQLKLALLGHVNPTPITEADVRAAGPDALGNDDVNRGGFLHSIAEGGPIVQKGRAYGFVVDFDLSLTLDETFTTSLPNDTAFENAYGAMLGGVALNSSPLVYPTAFTQNKRDPNQIYVVSMHSDDDAVVANPEYKPEAAFEEVDGALRERSDMTMGGAGLGKGSALVGGGVPKYGTDFYVKVQQLTLTPTESLMNVEPTDDEHVKRTLESGWGFGFKLNDAKDVRPSSVVFVRGRTPNDDLLLLGGTTRKVNDDGSEEYDGFITKLIPPAPSPVADQTTGSSVEDAIQDERVHPTKRIDSTTGRDETVTHVCLPPPDPVSGLITFAYVVGSTSSPDRIAQAPSSGHDPSLAYILKLRLSDLSTEWKEHVPSIHPSGLGGDVLGEGCAVSPDGTVVYLTGTIDGGSALDTRIMGNAGGAKIQPAGGKSDVFVVSYDTDFGNVHWAKQLGTVYEDKLARGGGVSCDNEGNVIIAGSTRGALQRYRPEKSDGVPRMPSDVFVMSLSRESGEYANAPYRGGVPPASSSGGNIGSPTSESSSTAVASRGSARHAGEGGLSVGAIVGICLTVIGSVFAVLVLVGLRRSDAAKRAPAERNGDVLRMWDDDDYSYDNNRSLGGRQSSASHEERSPGGTLRIVRGGRTDWGGGGRRGSHGGDDDSVHSAGSNSSRSKENSDFLASLREEANATMRKMVKESLSDGEAAKDPRLDGGASIKSLLTHYREIKKGRAIDVHGGDGEEEEVTFTGAIKRKGNRPPPPPPPPRRKNNQDEDEDDGADGLAEFTIV